MECDENGCCVMLQRYAVIDCEDSKKWEGHAQNIWIDQFKEENEIWDVFHAWKGELPDLDYFTYKGIIITGSRHAVYDDKPWIRNLLNFLKEIKNRIDHKKIREDTKIYGGCFGCQAIGQGLGGRVNRLPSGKFVFQTEKLQLTTDGKKEPLFEEFRTQSVLHVLQSHGDAVLELPPSSKLLASSATTDNEIFLVGDNFLACQAHPEFQLKQMDLILPGLKGSVLTEAESTRSVESFQEFSPQDHQKLINVVKKFLKE